MIAHSVSSADFEALATGRGGPAVVAKLAAAQVSRRLLKLRLILDAARNLSADLAANVHCGYDLLAQSQEQDPTAVAKILMYPSIGTWAALCIRGLRSGDRAQHDSAGVIGYLAAMAASAATRAGIDFQINVPIRSGKVFLPTLGMVQFTDHSMRCGIIRGESGVTQVIVGRNAVTVPSNDEPKQNGWCSLRRLRSTAEDLTIEVTLDDLDPLRNCYGFDVSDRISSDKLIEWQQRLDEAWSILVRLHPWYATAIQAGLTSLVPLRAASGGKGISTTSSEAFGACALSFPPDAQTLAVTLVHEFQHAKLGALHDLMPLHRAPPDTLYYSPWRDDPRPLHGLLHGAYAYLGVADLWRTERYTSKRTAFGDFEFARWRAETLDAVRIVEESGFLTATGDAFVAGMHSRLVLWCDEPVAELPRTAAETAIADHLINWRLRNLRASPTDVDRLAVEWLNGAVVSRKPSQSVVVQSGGALSCSRRIERIGSMVRSPVQFCSSHRGPGADKGEAADRALLCGDLGAAARLYGELIDNNPDCVDAWVGLALVHGPSSTLFRQPEIAYAVHRRVCEIAGIAPNPADLAEWLEAGNATSA